MNAELAKAKLKSIFGGKISNAPANVVKWLD